MPPCLANTIQLVQYDNQETDSDTTHDLAQISRLTSTQPCVSRCPYSDSSWFLSTRTRPAVPYVFPREGLTRSLVLGILPHSTVISEQNVDKLLLCPRPTALNNLPFLLLLSPTTILKLKIITLLIRMLKFGKMYVVCAQCYVLLKGIFSIYSH